MSNFPAEVTNGCGESEIMQLGGMQLMRNVLNVSRNLIGQSPNLPQFLLLQQIGMRRRSLIRFLNSVGQQRQPLIDVVVQLARQVLSLLLLRMYQPAT